MSWKFNDIWQTSLEFVQFQTVQIIRENLAILENKDEWQTFLFGDSFSIFAVDFDGKSLEKSIVKIENLAICFPSAISKRHNFETPEQLAQSKMWNCK